MTRRVFRLLSLLLVALLLVLAQSFAQGPTSQPNFAGFDTFVEQVMKDFKVPGLALAVVRDGKVLYSKGYGYRDVKNGLKTTPDTLFAILVHARRRSLQPRSFLFASVIERRL